MGSTIYIEKPWVLNSALTVLRLQQLNSVVFSDSVSVVAWTRWFMSEWGSVPFLLCSWGQCSLGYQWFSVLWQPVCWWPPAGVPDRSDQSPCRLVRWTEPFVLEGGEGGGREEEERSSEGGATVNEERGEGWKGVSKGCSLTQPTFLSFAVPYCRKSGNEVSIRFVYYTIPITSWLGGHWVYAHTACTHTHTQSHLV